ncbi:ATP-binding protein [Leptospira sp. 2 VSF19]|uniref:ATP-binding protein n=1 Tax=Leptospira soteropolitanensis TaxID=2950025 RepID=A0AAW5VK67_9LEPT|nr:ATP-binding protein [Leptospira soteropolitanensis]MCW7492211.1 ATP-binding protein [Leptospira soteropolitanensis]MCW7499793.1 ATP-binding protein [Leptospira soteropolitanensis]MCW7522044.1 ATP-binding protein [Leptospira soteropolitanensis]MCW7525898.1 ATP-binding protein [Leptospira soteropolitanensis]MCW7529988.1 ATP-binding protein [Leptospira soteropolitanensis]
MIPKRAEVGSLLYEWNGTKEIQVEVGIRRGLPNFQILGCASSLTKESRDRIRLALEVSGFIFPLETIIINLKPAHIPKRMVCLDLAIAVGILEATEQIQIPEGPILFLGGLGLDGAVLGGQELLPYLWQNRNNQDVTLCLPKSLEKENLPEGRYYFLEHLDGLRIINQSVPQILEVSPLNSESQTWEKVFLDPFQMKTFQGLLYAILGKHHSILLGSPGSGKTMLHRMLESLLPLKETRDPNDQGIWTLGGDFEIPTKKRPFRSPHHSATEVGLVGGGLPFQPGEISKAYGGVLYLDEALEFKDRILESLRMPMEDSYLEIVRLNEKTKIKTDFTLMLSANPCPCGNYHSNNTCHCSLQKIRLYLQKISGAFLDRITIFQTLFETTNERCIQLEEYRMKKILLDRIIFRKTRKTPEDEESKIQRILDSENRTKLLSLRKKKQIISLARTIADWDLSSRTKEAHIREAVEYCIGYQWIYSLG